VNPDIKWLDLGCGHQLLPSWRLSEEKDIINNSKILVGIDYDLISLINHRNIYFKIQGNITKLPFRDNSFNLVTANMVIEHLKNPNIVLQEVKRILSPQGIFIFHTPNAFGYNTIIARCVPNQFKKRLIYFLEGRREEDSFKTYYMLNTKNKIISLARKNGFQVSKIKMIISTPQLIMIPPVAFIQLILLRILMTKMFEPIRTNIITILKKEKN